MAFLIFFFLFFVGPVIPCTESWRMFNSASWRARLGANNGGGGMVICCVSICSGAYRRALGSVSLYCSISSATACACDGTRRKAAKMGRSRLVEKLTGRSDELPSIDFKGKSPRNAMAMQQELPYLRLWTFPLPWLALAIDWRAGQDLHSLHGVQIFPMKNRNRHFHRSRFLPLCGASR